MIVSLLALKALEDFKLPKTLEEAREIQLEIAKRVNIKPINPVKIRNAIALDVSYDKHSGKSHAAAVVFDFSSLEIKEVAVVEQELNFPYIPGFLAFREIPPILDALSCIKSEAELIICEGHGLLHPRRAGLASHLGVILDMPTVGVAKNLLFGKVDNKTFFEEDIEYRLIFDPETNEFYGAEIVKKGLNYKPIYVSIGHLVDLRSSLLVFLRIRDRFRIPKPLREAHKFSRIYRKKD
ncbi:MAG: endonuclease V [Actinobacteria bacterium]|nr:endonuclease V [Actinomycetota bacterium]